MSLDKAEKKLNELTGFIAVEIALFRMNIVWDGFAISGSFD